MDLTALSDDTLMGKVEALAETERFTLTDFLLHLGELDNRKACQNKGYSSVFAYLTRRLGYAEVDAMRRVRAARAARNFPSILRMLAQGRLHLVGISMLQPFLTSENHRRLLNQACGKSQREIEKLAAQLAPAAPEPRDRIRTLPTPSLPPQILTSAQMPQEPILSLQEAVSQQETASQDEPQQDSPITHPQTGSILTGSEHGLDTAACPAPATQQRRRLFTFVGGEEVHQWFLQARDLLRHKFPLGRMEDIIGEALRRLVEQKIPGRRKRKKTSQPLSASRRIPRWVRSKVWRRDGGRCSYVGPTGVRCGETAWLEYDHKTPWTLGGRSDDPGNIRLLCRTHNQTEADRIFGTPDS